jgi:N-methylhydantoinase A/oxoprolinase/acetone carboxylase beta subunit
VETVKRIHIIACGVLAMDLKIVAGRLGMPITTEYLPGGLHSTPLELRRRLQEAIDRASLDTQCEQICIGYGVCGLGTVGIRARGVPLSIPKVQDCIALFLGSDDAYRKQFADYPGTYYISAGWAEEKVLPKSMDAATQTGNDEDQSDHDREMAEHYGEGNAREIKDFFNSWQKNYQRAAFIDTGAGKGKQKYDDIARDMAKSYDWKYERIAGTHDLLERMLTLRHTTDDILIVPAHHTTAHDPLSKALTAVPVWQGNAIREKGSDILVFDGDRPQNGGGVKLGLGIDAGGTYTDVALYDFESGEVVEKAKALTTKYDYTIGIRGALDQLDPARLAGVNLVAISTTLATNAIVEGRGQKVGLLLMPPYGLYEEGDVSHAPMAVIQGKMEIDGTEMLPVDPEQVRSIVRDMVDTQGVGAFAVTGYASHTNPSHELQVKAIIQELTNLPVTCGHDVSEGLNYRVRAETACLNGRIIPCLEQLLDDVQAVLATRNIAAPVMVVKSDGSMMNVQTARQRPVQTIMSGPAASVAGARFLAGSDDALVVDMGGTTTDTATIEGGIVRTCADGAKVGGWETHVNALDMRTVGLGGDSRITLERRKLTIGPRRVAPVSWLAVQRPDMQKAFAWLERHIDLFDLSTQPMDFLTLHRADAPSWASDDEKMILDAIHDRPCSVHELAQKIKGDPWRPLSLDRLEQAEVIQRCALTPTDLLHVTSKVALWDGDAALRMTDLFAKLMGMERANFAEHALKRVVERLAVELLKTQMDDAIDPDTLDECPAAMALISNLLKGGSDRYQMRIELRRPVIGIGAPADCFLQATSQLLGTQCIIPPHADVANAVGAITSSVFVHKQVVIAPNEYGRYAIAGLPDAPAFKNFDEAHDHAVEALQQLVRVMAREAGTSQTRVEIAIDDRIADVTDGSSLFISRTLEGRLTGRPDMANATE